MAPIASKEETNMSYSISILLIRNLQDVFGENDPGRSRAADHTFPVLIGPQFD
jgi:hypothetical protein